MSQYGALGYAQHGKRYRFILGHYYRGTRIGRVNPQTSVRVLLGVGTPRFSGASLAGASKRLNPARTYFVRANADGTLTLVDQHGKALAQFASPLAIGGRGVLSLDGGLYRGTLEFSAVRGGVQTVEVVGLEDYVRGVISSEVPANWPREALKAQAVAARTYAITSNDGHGAFDVYADTRSQMYRGLAAETPSTDAAAAATRGQVVTYGGRPVVTYFFNSSGGHTENIENVWPAAAPRPWLRGAADPYDGAGHDPYHRWGEDLPVSNAIARLHGLVKGSLRGIEVLRHGSSPRILEAAVVGTRGRVRVSGLELQRAFGLLTTFVSFTTISTWPGPQASRASRRSASSPTVAETGAMNALVPLVDDLVRQSLPAIHGEVFPKNPRVSALIQVMRAGRWRFVARIRIRDDGSYEARLPRPGLYRIALGDIGGPAVRVS
jgi:stage II sporulation protein D